MIAKRAEYLRHQLNLYNYHYYTLGEPLINDVIYDKLYQELKDIEKAQPSLITKDSPTQKVGCPILDHRFEKVTRHLPMLSIENAFDEDVVVSTASRIGLASFMGDTFLFRPEPVYY